MKTFLLIHKNKIIIGFIIIMVLGAALLFGGSKNEPQTDIVAITSSPKPTETISVQSTAKPEEIEDSTPEPIPAQQNHTGTEEINTEAKSSNTESASDSTKDIKNDTDYAPAPVEEPGISYEIRAEENKNNDENKNTCTLSVRCDEILKNMDRLTEGKAELIPPDGIILAPVSVEFYDGESVFNVLQRELKKNKIHMEFVNTPSTNSAYIEGINNIYEMDCGSRSGWTYRVNGETPNCGCSQYKLKAGDVVEWVYVCDL